LLVEQPVVRRQPAIHQVEHDRVVDRGRDGGGQVGDVGDVVRELRRGRLVVDQDRRAVALGEFTGGQLLLGCHALGLDRGERQDHHGSG
jgi:hypothetical protein